MTSKAARRPDEALCVCVLTGSPPCCRSLSLSSRPSCPNTRLVFPESQTALGETTVPGLPACSLGNADGTSRKAGRRINRPNSGNLRFFFLLFFFFLTLSSSRYRTDELADRYRKEFFFFSQRGGTWNDTNNRANGVEEKPSFRGGGNPKLCGPNKDVRLMAKHDNNQDEGKQ